jgi:N-glycosylase/DNA lyase
MHILIEAKDVVLQGVNSFDIEDILECGQCFRFKKLEDKEYLIIAYNRLLRIKQIRDEIRFFNTTIGEFHKIWSPYFDLETDYEQLKNQLIQLDSTLVTAIDIKNGIRILKQELWEMIISFIISQNKQILHIKQIIDNISKSYGEKIGEYEGESYYSFPTVHQLVKVSEEELRACKVGFRAPYIIDACQKIVSGEIDLNEVKALSTNEVKEKLLAVKGVGNKIADCILLYGLGRSEVFPTDVWIKRIVEHLYLKEEVKVEKIQEFAANKFGDLAGYAQQYLFYYGRENKIGKK